LQAGANTITFGKGTAYAELDEIGLQPDHHRYEAETATLTDASAGHFPSAYTYPFGDFVGSINNADSAVSFSVNAPAAGVYLMQVALGNGSGTTSTYTLKVNGVAGPPITLPVNGGYLGSVGPAGQSIVTVPVTLTAGTNTIILGKGTSYAELNDINPIYTGAPSLIFGGLNEYLRLASDGTTLDVWYDTAPNGLPAYTVPRSQISTLAITPTSAGAANITIDFSNGNPVPTGGLTIDGTHGATLPLNIGIVGTTGNDNFTVNAATIAVGAVTINYAGAAMVTVNGDGGTDTITQSAQPSGGGGQLVLTGSTATDKLNINGGTFNVPPAAAGAGAVVYSLAQLTIAPAGKVVMASAATAPGDRTLLRVGTLLISGMLDIGKNDVDAVNGPFASLETHAGGKRRGDGANANSFKCSR
jgi:hypothetical protein